MTVHRCPDCVGHDRTKCRTCKGSAYVHRNNHGRIVGAATAREFFDAITEGRKPGPRPSPQGYRRRR